MRRLLYAFFAVLMLLLVGCGGNSNDSGTSSTPGDAAPAPMMPAPVEKGMATESRNQPDSVDSDRKEITTGRVYITTSDPIAAAAKTTDRVEYFKGRVDDRTEQPGTDNTQPHATLTVRVPSDKTDQLLEDLHGFGRVTSVSISKSDVTLQYEDVDARIKALQTSVDRLRALIAGATNTADVIEAENALSSRQAELDSLTAQKRSLDDQIDLSTLTIEFTTEDHPPSPGPDNFWDGLSSGWNALTDALGNFVVFVGSAIPWVVLLILICLVVYAVIRVVGGIRRARRPRPNQAEQQEGAAGGDDGRRDVPPVRTGPGDGGQSE